MTQAQAPLEIEVANEAKQYDANDAGEILRLIGQLESLHGTCARQKVELQQLNRAISRRVHHLKRNRRVLDFLLEYQVTFVSSARHENFDGAHSDHLVPWIVARIVYLNRPLRGSAGRSRREAVASLMILVEGLDSDDI